MTGGPLFGSSGCGGGERRTFQLYGGPADGETRDVSYCLAHERWPEMRICKTVLAFPLQVAEAVYAYMPDADRYECVGQIGSSS